MKYELVLHSEDGSCIFEHNQVKFVASRTCEEAFFNMEICFSQWEESAYVFLPACAYNGNRFARMASSYPPMYREDQIGEAPEPIMTEVPALNPDGSGRIEVTAGDLSVPCVGIYFRQKKQAFLLFTEQECKGHNIGFSVERGRVTIQFPAHRAMAYCFCKPWIPSGDRGIAVQEGETVSVRLKIETFDCEDIPAFFEGFFRQRKCLLRNEPAPNLYSPSMWDIMEKHFNEQNWSGEYYAEITHVWQCGWVGGGQSSLALLKKGHELSRERAVATVDYMTSHIAPSGFFYGAINQGVVGDDSFGTPHLAHAHLIRKSADGLYYLFKHFDVMQPKDSWVSAARTVSNAFVALYQKYGSFGQFIHDETGEMLFGGTTSGATAIGALARAYSFFGEEEYLDIACRAAEKYYREFVAEGLTYGGPGEAMCAPDSESSYGMVESLTVLYETTKDEKWLNYAKDAAHLFSSWVVTYSYRFPSNSEFERLGINTVGSVFANVQNKHSAPGICTFSGKALYLLYKYTGDRAYLDLLRDIALYIPQSVSTKERPIFSRPKKNIPSQALPEGYINERVNMSDWEGSLKVGTVFYGSCWCETSLILSFTELFDDPEISHAIFSL